MTAHQKNQLRYLLGLKTKTWAEIAHIMGCGETCCREHARRMGLNNEALNPVPYLHSKKAPNNAKVLRPGQPTLPPLPSLQMPMPVIRGE